MATALALVSMGTAALVNSPARASLRGTPRGSALVVTANLDEFFEPRDIHHVGDMRAFLRRLPRVVPYVPDVLLLQEVRHHAAAFVAHALTSWYGSKFVVAVGPGRAPFRYFPHRVVTTDTAILLNLSTMSRVSRGGFVSSRYPKRAGVPGIARVVKKEAYLLAARRGSNFRMTLSSVHFVPPFDFRSRYRSNFYRGRWSRDLARALKSRFPDIGPDHLFVIGGDFNSSRCLNRVAARCRRAPFWRALTSSPLGLRDSLYSYGHSVGHSSMQPNAGVDYIFSTGNIFSAGSDSSYLRQQAHDHYSDHQFYWAVVGTGGGMP